MSNKKLGTYRYNWRPPYQKASTPCFVRVEVVDESSKQYLVKYNGFHANGSAPGSLHWVSKKKVALDKPTPDADVIARIIRNRTSVPPIRLPYKDNDE